MKSPIVAIHRGGILDYCLHVIANPDIAPRQRTGQQRGVFGTVSLHVLGK
jgi:hypothetical protein